MNERIRELLVEAGVYECDDFEPHPTFEKFAELIVRECMKESMDEIVPDKDIAETSDPLAREYLKGNNQGIVDAVVRFRNHFGVEP